MCCHCFSPPHWTLLAAQAGGRWHEKKRVKVGIFFPTSHGRFPKLFIDAIYRRKWQRRVTRARRQRSNGVSLTCHRFMLQAIMIAGPNDRLAIVFFGKYFFGKGKSPIDMERSQGVKKLQRSSTRVHIIRMHEHERLRNPFHNPIIRSHRKTSFALSVFCF